MLYEAKVSYKTTDEKGAEVLKKEWYVIANAECFAQVEQKMYESFNYSCFKDVDVTDIKRSRIKELANYRNGIDEKLFVAEVQDTFTTDDGVEKELKYKILFFSTNMDDAMTFINEYIKQGYDMTLVSLKETKFKDVL